MKSNWKIQYSWYSDIFFVVVVVVVLLFDAIFFTPNKNITFHNAQPTPELSFVLCETTKKKLCKFFVIMRKMMTMNDEKLNDKTHFSKRNSFLFQTTTLNDLSINNKIFKLISSISDASFPYHTFNSIYYIFFAPHWFFFSTNFFFFSFLYVSSSSIFFFFGFFHFANISFQNF